MPTSSISKLELRPSASAHIIAANRDLLGEILIRLPVKCLLRFKSVSNRWLSLITCPHFCHRKSCQNLNNAISGFFVHRISSFIDQDYDFVPLGDDKQPFSPPFQALTFAEDQSGITILQSCNGLLLCRSFRVQNCKCNYYIFNPTTRQFTNLPDPLHLVFVSRGGILSVYAVNLALDPRKFPYYKVICIYFSNVVRDRFEIETFTSETGLWRHIGNPFSSEVNFDGGVYWNGAINWLSYSGDALYFNIDQELFETLPMLSVPDGREEEGRRIRYFSESNDHLNLIEIYGPLTTQFNVYEMDREYSGWFFKYSVDLGVVMNALPECICTELDSSHLHYYSFLILGVVQRKDDQGSFLVLSIPGKAVRDNFEDKSFKKLCDFATGCEFGGSPIFG